MLREKGEAESRFAFHSTRESCKQDPQYKGRRTKVNSSALDPDIGFDGPILHGEPPDSLYTDDEEIVIVDDESGSPGDIVVDSAWTVDTGYGEVIAPTAPVRVPD